MYVCVRISQRHRFRYMQIHANTDNTNKYVHLHVVHILYVCTYVSLYCMHHIDTCIQRLMASHVKFLTECSYHRMPMCVCVSMSMSCARELAWQVLKVLSSVCESLILSPLNFPYGFKYYVCMQILFMHVGKLLYAIISRSHHLNLILRHC